MGTVTLSKQNRLFWLGRYTERVYTTIQFLCELYDQIIDGKEVDYPAICRQLGIPRPYTGSEDFCRRYLFDRTDPGSVISSVDNMLGNGMVLRLGTAENETLRRELQKLLNRLYKTDLTADPAAMEVITQKAMDGAEVEPARLLASVEGLFLV